MTTAPDPQARNDRASFTTVHDPDKCTGRHDGQPDCLAGLTTALIAEHERVALAVRAMQPDDLLAEMRAGLELRAMQPDEDALTDEPIPYLPSRLSSTWDRLVEVVVTLGDARRVVDMAKHALQHPPYPGYSDLADRAALERFANVIDAEWLAQ